MIENKEELIMSLISKTVFLVTKPAEFLLQSSKIGVSLMSDALRNGSSLGGKHMASRKKFLH